jgi:hypothetical protein
LRGGLVFVFVACIPERHNPLITFFASAFAYVLSFVRVVKMQTTHAPIFFFDISPFLPFAILAAWVRLHRDNGNSAGPFLEVAAGVAIIRHD